MRTLAVYNIKGGVGKTTAAVNLAWLAARSGRRCLLWDLDPQGGASFYYRIKPKVKGGGRRIVRGKGRLDRRIKATDFELLDLLPADFSYRNMDLELDATTRPARRLRTVLKPLARDYDLLFIDCAPNISLVSESVFGASDVLLVPTIPTTLSLRTLGQLEKHLARHRRWRLDVLPFFSMVDGRKSLHRQVCATAPGESRFDFLATRIPASSHVERMGLERRPVGTYAPRCSAAAAFSDLWAEIEQRLESA